MVAATPFSSVLHQLLSNSKPTSSKGKGKAKLQPVDFLSTLKPLPESKSDWKESIDAFVKLVENYEKDVETNLPSANFGSDIDFHTPEKPFVNFSDNQAEDIEVVPEVAPNFSGPAAVYDRTWLLQ
ncbi:unnamed protein product [Mucor hiemalis]